MAVSKSFYGKVCIKEQLIDVNVLTDNECFKMSVLKYLYVSSMLANGVSKVNLRESKKLLRVCI